MAFCRVNAYKREFNSRKILILSWNWKPWLRSQALDTEMSDQINRRSEMRNFGKAGRMILAVVMASITVSSVGCSFEKSPRGEPALWGEPVLEGNLRLEGHLIEAFTSIEPVFSFNNLDTGQRSIKPRTEYNKGHFKIYGLPKANYHIFISINANTDNPGGYPGYPGDFYKRVHSKNTPLGGLSEILLRLKPTAAFVSNNYFSKLISATLGKQAGQNYPPYIVNFIIN